MKKSTLGLLVGCSVILLVNSFAGALRAGAQDAPPPIKKIEISADRAFIVNGQPFFPIFSWLQDAKNFPEIAACGINSTAGALPRSSGVKDVAGYLELARKAGLYGIMPFEPASAKALKSNPALLAYIHGDEPDLTHAESDAQVVAASQLKVNRSNPLWKLVDGVTTSWTVLDPLKDAAVTIKLKAPVTVVRLGVWMTVSNGLSTASEVRFTGDGKPLLSVRLEPKKGRQSFDLPNPVSFSELKMTVVAVTPGDQVYGSFGEIEAFDADDKNVLLSPPRQVPRAQPADVQREYAGIKQADPSRPVFMTLTAHFMPDFRNKAEASLASLYPEYIKATDVVGFDVYPIYGWNKPEWLPRVGEGADQLAHLAGPRPVYAWIETSKGGQYTGALERQKDVTPAHIRAEVWMSICRGATAIGYFTHVWKPAYRQFGVPDENRKALRAINSQITRLAPAILGASAKRAVSLKAEGAARIDMMAKETGDTLSIFAVNYGDEAAGDAKAAIAVAGLAAGQQVTVVDEGRTITAQAGSFSDTFQPLGVHIYQINGLAQ